MLPYNPARIQYIGKGKEAKVIINRRVKESNSIIKTVFQYFVSCLFENSGNIASWIFLSSISIWKCVEYINILTDFTRSSLFEFNNYDNRSYGGFFLVLWMHSSWKLDLSADNTRHHCQLILLINNLSRQFSLRIYNPPPLSSLGSYSNYQNPSEMYERKFW